MLRPSLAGGEHGAAVQIFLAAYPNFCEAVIGGLLLTGIALTLNARLLSPQRRLPLPVVYGLAWLATGLYVLLQEIKVHDLGGRNVYDPYDVAFSIGGLLVVAAAVFYFRPEPDEHGRGRW